MLVYPQRRPSAMRFTVSRASSCKGTSTSISSFLSGRAIERHSPTDSGWVGFFFFRCFQFQAILHEKSSKKEKEGFPSHGHQIYSASAQVCSSDTQPFARDLSIPETEGGPFRLQRVRGAAEDIGFSQNEFSSSDYIACISFFECQRQMKAIFTDQPYFSLTLEDLA